MNLNFKQIFDDLTFINYACNRDSAPSITPESWKKVYGNAAVDQMEPRYLAQKAITKAKIDAELDSYGI